MFDKRVHSIGTVSTPEELAEKLTEHTWTLCTGFRLGKLLFLNDATHEDGAGEYAVVLEGSAQSIQIESITFSWCNYARALELIRECMTYAEGTAEPPIKWPVALHTDHHYPCHLCQ